MIYLIRRFKDLAVKMLAQKEIGDIKGSILIFLTCNISTLLLQINTYIPWSMSHFNTKMIEISVKIMVNKTCKS